VIPANAEPIYEYVGQTEQSLGTPTLVGYRVSTPSQGGQFVNQIYDVNGNFQRTTSSSGKEDYGVPDLMKLAAFAGGVNMLGSAIGGGGFGGFGGAGGGAAPGIGGASGAGGAVGGGLGGGLGGAGAGTASAGAKLAGSKIFEYLIPAAASLIGSGLSASAAKSAAGESAAAADRATQLQQKIYEESVARQQPFLQTGTEFFNRLAAVQRGGPEAQQFLQMDPGYQFRLSEGLKALDRQAAARGGLISGGALKAAQRYGQDLGSQEFGAAYNRLASMANVGPQAAGVMSNLGQNYATNVGNIYQQQGNTAANAALARGSAYAGGLNQLGYLAGRYYGQPSGAAAGGPVASTPYDYGVDAMYGPRP